MRAVVLAGVLAALMALNGAAARQAPQPSKAAPVVYEVYAIRYGTLAGFSLGNLVAGGDRAQRLDIPLMFWLLKGSDGRIVLVDSGFCRDNLVD